MKYGIVIVGCGPGSPEYLTPAATEAVYSADVLVGAQRLLDLFPDATADRIAVAGDLQSVLDRVEAFADRKRVAVLVTGDPGLFSFAKLVIKRFGRERCSVIPGVSSVQVAFARIGLDWTDATIISAHKEDPEYEATLGTREKMAVLGGRDGSLKWIAEHLLPSDSSSRVFVFEDLTTNDEKVTEVTPEELATLRASSRTIVLIIKRSLLT